MQKAIQYCFERYEKKYFLTPQQKNDLLWDLTPYMKADDYGAYTICNIYYDTMSWQLIRASIEKPDYKEKLRVRSYGVPQENGNIFVELKKKCGGIVYKRRITTELSLAEPFLRGEIPGNSFGQIGKELEWFQTVYKAEPKVFIAYDREAFAGRDDPDLRITFDQNIRWRTNDLNLCLGDAGKPLLPDDRILMEIKIPGTCPLWLSRLLSEKRMFPVSFSKYGTCYREHIFQKEFFDHAKEEHLSA